MIRQTILLILLAVPCLANATDTPSCTGDAISRAKPLLTLHFGEDDRISIADKAKELPSIRIPSDPKQRFKVYEVWGFIYKGKYRMRFIYYASAASGCTLMGQEISEHSSAMRQFAIKRDLPTTTAFKLSSGVSVPYFGC